MSNRIHLQFTRERVVSGDDGFNVLANDLADRFYSDDAFVHITLSGSINHKGQVPVGPTHEDSKKAIKKYINDVLKANKTHKTFLKLQQAEAKYKKRQAKYEACLEEEKRKNEKKNRRSLSPDREPKSNKKLLKKRVELPRQLRSSTKNILSEPPAPKPKITHVLPDFIEDDIEIPTIPELPSGFDHLKPHFMELFNNKEWLSEPSLFIAKWSENPVLIAAYKLMCGIQKQSMNPAFNDNWLLDWIQKQLTCETWHSASTTPKVFGVCNFCAYPQAELVLAFTPNLNEADKDVLYFDHDCGKKFKYLANFLTAVHELIDDVQKGKVNTEKCWIDFTVAMTDMQKVQ
jgi:hypothetical protein